MDLINWKPLSELEHLLTRRGMMNSDYQQDWRPAANISESEKEYLIRADLPDVDADDVSLTVENGVITLSGERHVNKRDEQEKSLRVETFHGTFTRSFSLPENVDAGAIKAEHKKGVLTVHLPKCEPKSSSALKIPVTQKH